MFNFNEAASSSESNNQVLAIEYVPIQRSSFEKLFGVDEAIVKGTVFPELYLPFCAEGGEK